MSNDLSIDSILEKGTGILNEDFQVINGNIFGVFDGATSLNKKLYDNGFTGGYLASNLAGEIFKRNDEPLNILAYRANKSISTAMKDFGVDTSDKGNLWSTSAAVVRITGGFFEWIQIGDSLIMAIDKNGRHQIIPGLVDHDRETLCMWKELCTETDKEILPALHDQILKVRRGMNIDYGVLSGEREAMDFLNHGYMSLNEISHIVLFTDGLFIPNCEPEKPVDFESFAEIYLQFGLKGLRDHIRDIESRDIGCRFYPRFKTHDDISAVSISF